MVTPMWAHYYYPSTYNYWWSLATCLIHTCKKIFENYFLYVLLVLLLLLLNTVMGIPLVSQELIDGSRRDEAIG